jgi:uncharacterized protein YfaS (alpha-2-macroglobulin family)
LVVEQFTPQGAVSAARQVRARFSADIALLGDLRALPNPFDVSCFSRQVVERDPSEAAIPDGVGRWLDSATWVYEFTADLPSEVGCTFELTKEFKAAHPAMSGPRVFSFATEQPKPPAGVDPCKPGGPMVVGSVPATASGEEERDEFAPAPSLVDENQSFVLFLNCPAEAHSVTRSVYFEVEGMKDRVGVQVLDGAAREKVLAERSLAGRENALVLRPRLTFPAGGKATLVWGKGVKSASGAVRGSDMRLEYAVRPPFAVSTRCSHTFSDGSCDPFLPIYAVFTSEVESFRSYQFGTDEEVVLRAADGRRWYGKKAFFSENRSHYHALKFSAPFPPKEALKLVVPEWLRDKTGRAPSNRQQLPLTVRTGKIPPMVRFNAIFGIVERNAGAALPMTVRSIDADVASPSGADPSGAPTVSELTAKVAAVSNPSEILPWIVAVQNRYENIEKNTSSLFDSSSALTSIETLTVKKPLGPEPFEVVGIPFKKPGFYLLEVASPSLGRDLHGPGTTAYVPTTALVTNLAVHLKLGKESSLAWVTSLDSGAPVEDADVTVHDCKGAELFRGRSDRAGIVHIPALPSGWEEQRCGLEQKWVSAPGVTPAAVRDGVLITSARLGDDLSFVLSTWDEGIEPWRYGLNQDYYQGRPQRGHTILDRALFKRGETVHFKTILRRKAVAGFELVPNADMPPAMALTNLATGERTPLPLTWKANGSAEGAWKIPPDAKLGDYNLFLQNSDGSIEYPPTAAFSVLDYRVPLMRGVIVPPQEDVLAPGLMPLDVSVRYLAGGGASDLPVKLRYKVMPAAYSFGGLYEDFLFAQDVQPVRCDAGYAPEPYEGSSNPPLAVRTVSGVLDQSGSARLTLESLPQIASPAKLFAELEYKDPNGEIQTVSSQLPLLPSSYLVGIKTAGWANLQKSFQFSVATVSGNGKAVPKRPVVVRLLQREVYSHRKKLVGGTFAYENTVDQSDRGVVCSGTTDETGILRCNADLQLSGEFVLEASSTDAQGRQSQSASVVFVGQEDYWFAQENTDRMDLLPEKKHYEPGDTARFQVRVPFKSSTALVTVEREGIVDAFVVPLSRSNPIIELPVKENYGPNVFVSVMAVRGRIDEVKPTAVFDPAKPAFRLGMAQIRVGWKGYSLKVGVNTERSVYKVRQKVPVKIQVRTADGALPPQGSEVAVAAVDEGLLDLKPNTSWNLLESLMDERWLAVRTMTAQMFVVGKRHFGLKALPFGGGGGKSTSRELFDTLLYWNPAVTLDQRGEATVEMPLNDSITSFKIVAVATGGAGRFGTGSTSIRSSKDFILFAGMPLMARGGDSFTFEVTARNTTSEAATVAVSLQSSPAVVPAASQEVTLASGESRVLTWPMRVPTDTDQVRYSAVISRAGEVEDSLVVSQKIAPAVPVRVQQSTLLQLTANQSVPVAAPRDAVVGKGGLQISFLRSLGDAGAGLREYMAQYPFGCLEQRVSKAVALADTTLWDTIRADLSGYVDRDGFAKYFPSMDRGDETLTAYLLSIAHEAGWSLPDALQKRMVAALKRFIEGKVRTLDYQSIERFYSDVGYKLQAISAAELDLLSRRIAALEALARYGEVEPSTVTGLWPAVRALPTASLVNLLSIAARMEELPGRATRLAEIEQELRARLDLQGTTLQFRGEDREGFFWLMTSADVAAVRFVGTVFGDDALYGRFSKDAGRLVRGILERQRQGHWDLTVANAWGRIALERQRQRLEPTPPEGTSTAGLEGQRPFEVRWEASAPLTATFAWPPTPSKLTLAHTGKGAPWVMLESHAAIPRTAPVAAGYQIHKTIEPVQKKNPGEYRVGDVARVKLSFSAQAGRTWVVVDDPIPAGASILGNGLGRDSALLTEGSGAGWSGPTFEERGFDGYRGYFRELPKGDGSVEYLIRFNTPGQYILPATRIEAMYSPEMFGELPNGVFTVLP